MTSFLNRRLKPSFGISEKDPSSQKLHSLKLFLRRFTTKLSKINSISPREKPSGGNIKS